MNITAYWLAERFIGLKETPGPEHHPRIVAMLQLDAPWFDADETPWCSAFVNEICWLLRLPRSKSARARSWLGVGKVVPLEEARVGFDVVILKRGGGDQPGPNVLDAPGHVGFFAGREGGRVALLGGNQADQVSVAAYPQSRVLGVRRLREELLLGPGARAVPLG